MSDFIVLPTIGKFLHELKTWTRSESDLFFGSHQPNPHDVVSCAKATKSRLQDYHRKVQTERCDFHVRDKGTVALRSMVGRTTMRNHPIQVLHNLHMMLTSSEEPLISFLYRKRYLHMITKVNNNSPPNLLSSHACTCPEFLKQGACKHVISFLVVKRHVIIPPELNVTRISRLPRVGRPRNAGGRLDLLEEILQDVPPETTDSPEEATAV